MRCPVLIPLMLLSVGGFERDGLAQAVVQGGDAAVALQKLLDEDSYIQFARRLPSATGLKPEQKLYFDGTLAYRQGRFKDVVKPLIAAVNMHDTSLTSSQKEAAFELLGQTAFKTFEYGSSAQMYDDIDKIWSTRIGDEITVIREKRHIGALLQHVPVQTIAIAGDFSLKRAGEEYPVVIGGKTFSAQLDTGATISVLSESTAAKGGVTILDGTATMHGYGGGSFSARPGLVPELSIGKATLHNVTVMVTADEDLYLAAIRRQTNALLGFPVASALGRLTFARDGTLSVTAAPSAGDEKAGAALWIGNSSLLVALGTDPVVGGNKVSGSSERLFEVDTGSGSTYLTDHYLAEHADRFPGKPLELARLAGAGGIHEIPAYPSRQLPLFFGNTPVLCNGQHVLTQTQGGEAERYYGVIGQDLLGLFSSYTIDFGTMRFSVLP